MSINTSSNNSGTVQHSSLRIDLNLIRSSRKIGLNGISRIYEIEGSDEYSAVGRLGLNAQKAERTVKQCMRCSQKFYKDNDANLKSHHFCFKSGQLQEVPSACFARQGLLFLKNHLKGPLPKLDLRSANRLTEHKTPELEAKRYRRT